MTPGPDKKTFTAIRRSFSKHGPVNASPVSPTITQSVLGLLDPWGGRTLLRLDLDKRKSRMGYFKPILYYALGLSFGKVCEQKPKQKCKKNATGSHSVI